MLAIDIATNKKPLTFFAPYINKKKVTWNINEKFYPKTT
jgi:hypothetical protein